MAGRRPTPSRALSCKGLLFHGRLSRRLLAGGSIAASMLATPAPAAPPPVLALAPEMAARPARPPAGSYRQQPVLEQDVAHERVRRGELWRLDELLSRAQRVGGGEYLGVEPQGMGDRYRFKFRRSGGAVIWVDMDGRTGDVLAVHN